MICTLKPRVIPSPAHQGLSIPPPFIMYPSYLRICAALNHPFPGWASLPGIESRKSPARQQGSHCQFNVGDNFPEKSFGRIT